MLLCEELGSWFQFVDFIKKKCSSAEFQNWFSPIKLLKETKEDVTLEVPNIFVREYILENYKKELFEFLPQKNGELALIFVIAEQTKTSSEPQQQVVSAPLIEVPQNNQFNIIYTFDTFIEGPSNQFVKSAAQGVAHKPGKTFNPLFIHGGVGLGKTHILHGIGNYVKDNHKRLQTKYITTEYFINDLMMNLRDKSLDKMKKFYRNLDLLLVDDIQFLQNRPNFEEEFCNTFEALINQNKQIVITSDKPPSQLKLSERIVARMEWGLVAGIGIPDLETRVAIIQQKAQLKGVLLTNNIAFFIADHMYNNIRQLEGAINRLAAYTRLTKAQLTESFVEEVLHDMFNYAPSTKITIESILKSVSVSFDIRISDLKGESRTKEIAMARQVSMFLAKELLNDSLTKIATSFGGKSHSTLLHAWKKIAQEQETNPNLKKQIDLIKKNLASA